MYKLLLLIPIFSFAQLPNNWDVTDTLSEMNKSWSVGNGCEEDVFVVADNYGMLELCGNTLEIMDCRIQVVDGWVTNFGERVDINNIK